MTYAYDILNDLLNWGVVCARSLAAAFCCAMSLVLHVCASVCDACSVLRMFVIGLDRLESATRHERGSESCQQCGGCSDHRRYSTDQCIL